MIKKYFSLFAVLAVTLTGSAFSGEEKRCVAETPVPRNSVKWWNPRVEAKIAKAEKEGKSIRLVFLGDSIIHYLGDETDSSWREFSYCRLLNAGFAGDQTQNTLWHLEKTPLFDLLEPKLIVVLIGTNNGPAGISAEDTSRGIRRIVETLRKKQPQAKILLFGLFPRGPKKESAYRKVNSDVNRIICHLADGENVFYEDISGKFLQEDGTLPEALFPDGLHPSRAGYRIWFDAIRPYVYRFIGKPEPRR